MKIVQNMLREYDFIGLVERLDESLVLLRLLLGLNAGDILYISAKQSGGYDAGGYKGTCYKIAPSFTTPEMKDYLNGDEWYKRNEIMLWMHKAVNRIWI